MFELQWWDVSMYIYLGTHHFGVLHIYLTAVDSCVQLYTKP